MFKAVFFDWFSTLARYEPPREQVFSQVLQELGFQASPAGMRRGFLVADRAWYEENAASPTQERTPEERAQRFARHQERILREAGVDVPQSMLPDIFSRMRRATRNMTFVLYDDVLDTLRALKQRDLAVGVLTNMRGDIAPMCRQLGMEPYLDFALTSEQVGAEKPDAPIFRRALERAGVTAAEAMHVGDQYVVDIVGARGVGITPILLDRSDMYPDVNDCPRIRGLAELAPYLD